MSRPGWWRLPVGWAVLILVIFEVFMTSVRGFDWLVLPPVALVGLYVAGLFVLASHWRRR